MSQWPAMAQPWRPEIEDEGEKLKQGPTFTRISVIWYCIVP